MAAQLAGVLNNSLAEKINSSKILVVGAGGIGCELLKNLVLTGFRDIEIIDLDTIDVSNLNRQFLFHKQHVGMSKAKVAQESAQRFNKDARIKAYHDSITCSDYGINFFKRFSLVMNALDNRAARNHVNRMCLAADIPLIESGTAGYLGQVSLIKKGLTECYECQPKAGEKTYPGCTIRNTPSEPIHCIVWAKHLFNQLFGEADPDEDVSPDTADPEAAGDAGSNALTLEANEKGNVNRISTRAWAVSSGYAPVTIFNKLFHKDIDYLLSMDKLWQKRRSPVPLDWDNLPDAAACSSSNLSGMRDQRFWSIQECASVFSKCVTALKTDLESLKEGDHLVWDKDNDTAMDFVTACSNIRAFIFGIPQKSRFDIKSMAGNIIPAIATTNAVIAGLIVIEGMKIIEGRLKDCKAVFLSKQPHPKSKRILAVCSLEAPNPNCFVCSSKPEVSVKLNPKTFTVKMLEEKVLKLRLNMVAPDVEVDDGKGTILISSEEGETTENNDRALQDFSIIDGSRLKCDDFLQNYQLILNIIGCERLEEEAEFEIVGSISELVPQQSSKTTEHTSNGTDTSKHTTQVEDDDDLLVMETNFDEGSLHTGKRELEDMTSTLEPANKRMKPLPLNDADDDEITIV